jgi:hypothetical protein
VEDLRRVERGTIRLGRLTRESARQLALDLLAVADQADSYEALLTAAEG